MSTRKSFQPRVRILANAGSGKTYALVTRCIQLLHLGAEPHTILALTFTRSAAGEFLREVFLRLAGACEDPAKLEVLRNDLNDQNIARADCLRWLRVLIRELPRLSMGTMDQFFARLIRAFPLEAGSGNDFALLDGAARQEAFAECLAHLLEHHSRDSASFEAFQQLLREIKDDKDSVSVWEDLIELFSNLQEFYLSANWRTKWGDPSILSACKKLSPSTLTDGMVAQSAKAFVQEVRQITPELDPEVEAKLTLLVDESAKLAPHKKLNKELSSWFERRLNWRVTKSATYLNLGQKKHLRIPWAEPLVGRAAQLRDALWQQEMGARMVFSQRLFDLLTLFEQHYEETIRSAGFLTFTDIARLLESVLQQHSESVAYRLDCRFDHIVLDEFQDTSRRQWNLLKVLADEILQDSEERRSFFYVGDTKQSIYGWRNGDDRLFREIFDHYNQHQPDWIKDEKLKVSYRSDRKIIQVVNALFCPDTCREGSEEFELSEKLVQRWQASWVDHSARENAGEGYVALIEYPEPEKPPTSKSKTGSVDAAAIDATTNPVAVERDEDEEAEDSPTLAGDVLGILQEVQPWLRGLTCGVLTRNNQEAEDLAKHLRENHIPTRLEGRAATIATNPESYALYNLIRSVAYHHDPMAAAFLTISPWRILVPDALSDREKVAKFRRAAQQSVAAEGFLKTIRKWVEVAASAGVVNSTKLEAMLDAVEEFATTKKPLDSWGSLVGFLESHQTEDALTTGVVQVMTIHKAKGLGMDVVVLPQLHIPWAKPLRAQDLATVRSEQGLIESALKLPSAPYCDEDEFLAGLRGQFIDDRIFEEFCCFYVAVTRAKQALYFITRPHRKGDSTKSIAQWVQKFFPASQPSARAGQATDLRAEGGGRDRPKMEIRELGNPRWFENKPLREQQAPAIFQQADKSSSAFPKPQGEIKPQPPSGNRARTVSGSQLFPAAAATQLGSEVHELLAQVLWREQEPDYRSVSPRAAKIVRSFLQTSSASFLDQPVQPVMVWREKAFDVMLNGVPVSGIFDRVHVYKNADGTVASAEIFDYKTTSSGEDLPENYVSQIETYRRAAAALLALSESSIQAHIIPITTAAR